MVSAFLVFQDEVSNKFWNLETNGKSLTTSWGRIGTIGQTKTKSHYASSFECENDANKLIKSKVKKGYVEAINETLLTQVFIEVLSGISKRKNENEIYYRDDKFNKMATIELVDGMAHIIFRQYYENGQKKSECHWVDNKQDGDDLGWYEDGSKHWERKFVAGKMTYEKRY